MNENKSNLTPKKKLAVAAAVMALVLVAAATGTVLAVGSFNQSTSIGEANAQNFAFLDAGVDPAEAEVERTEFDYEQGQFVYEVEFTHNGTEYEYWVKASDGSIVKKGTELVAPEPQVNPTVPAITLEQAREIALRDAGLSAGEVTFTESEAEKDDGNDSFELEFKTETTKYEYEIDSTGHIYSKSKEPLPVTAEPKPAESEPTSEKESEAQSKPATKSPASSSSASNLIGLDKAKSIAADRAGISLGDVTFTKAKLDHDDGKKVYELEFYKGNMEYECEVDAKTGKILDYDEEHDD